MKMYLRIILLVFYSTLLTTIAVAQTATTGTIDGTVADATGAIVPGAAVRATSANLMQPQTAISDSQGDIDLSICRQAAIR